MKFPKLFNELPEYFSHIRQYGSNYAPALDTVVADADGFNDDLITPQAMIEVSKSQTLSKLAAQRNYAHGNSMSQPYAWTSLLHDQNLKEQGIDANDVYYGVGNMFGSPKGISGKLPEVSAASKYNRAGYDQKMQEEGPIHELGFFSEHICDDYLFDPINREYEKRRIHEELTRRASEIEENILLQDLNNGAGVHYFCGGAYSNATMTNRRGNVCEFTYKDFLKIRKTLKYKQVPENHKVYTGSQNANHCTVTEGWTIYCPPEMILTLKTMRDLSDQPAFIPAWKYEATGNTVEGEIGRIDEFRFVEVQDMLRWEGAGDYISKAFPVSDTEGQERCVSAQEDGVNNTYINNGSRYTVFSLLIVGDNSFVNLQSYKSNCRISHCLAADDPFGNHLISSIWWKYGILITHPERLMCVHSLARQ